MCSSNHLIETWIIWYHKIQLFSFSKNQLNSNSTMNMNMKFVCCNLISFQKRLYIYIYIVLDIELEENFLNFTVESFSEAKVVLAFYQHLKLMKQCCFNNSLVWTTLSIFIKYNGMKTWLIIFSMYMVRRNYSLDI